MDPQQDQFLWMYETMLVIRDFEERMVNVYLEGKLPPDIQTAASRSTSAAGPVPGEMHLAAGQEPVAVGVCAHLRDEDTVVGTHRPHHFAIAKGVPLDRLAAELFGKATGLSRGKGGHMHLFDPEHKFSLQRDRGGEHAAGHAARRSPRRSWAATRSRSPSSARAPPTRGRSTRRSTSPALWKLPVVFVCEDNSWAISVPKSKSTAIASNADRAAAYGMPGVSVEHNDALEVFSAAGEAVARARRGDGPDADRGADRPLPGPLPGRRRGLPPEGRGRRAARARPDPARWPRGCAATACLDDALDEEIRSRARGARDRRRTTSRARAPARAGRGARARLRLRRGESHGSCHQGTHAHDGPGHLRSDRPGDGARRARLRDGRGHRQLRRHLQRHQRPARPLRPRADHGHADLRGRRSSAPRSARPPRACGRSPS